MIISCAVKYLCQWPGSVQDGYMSALHCEKCTSSGRTSTWGIWITERKTLIGSMYCVGYHCWFSSLSLFSVLILSKWNVTLRLLSLYLCIWYHCCCHALQCLRHVTISLLLGSMLEIVRVCVCVCVCICILDIRTACIVNILCQQIKHHSFSGSSYHIDMLKCELFTHLLKQ